MHLLPHTPVKDVFGLTWPAWQYFGEPKPPLKPRSGRGGRRNRKARRARRPREQR